LQKELANFIDGKIKELGDTDEGETPKKRGRGRPKGTGKKRGRPTGAVNRGPGRPKGATNKRGPGRPKGTANKRQFKSLKGLILQIIGRARNGVGLKDLVEKCLKAGYKVRSGDPTKFVASVRTNLHTLEKKEKLILKDKEKRYRLTKKAVKAKEKAA
jgi:hypothetical protein